VPVEVQIAALWAIQNGFFDDVKIERVKECQSRLTDYLTTTKAAVLAKIGREQALSEPLTAELKAAVEQFKKTWS
jgi:F-type H+-transporting ATPase subunit alpha